MTRRLFAAITLATVAGLTAATPASATEDDAGFLCIGGENQRKPNSYTYICVDDVLGVTGLGGAVEILR